MNPTQTPQADGFKPKWRHFHPLSRIWVQNPFDHDVVFQVADEYNRPFKYRLPGHKVSELPGGAIATLGVKAIVDELIQNSKEDEMRMWDENVRRKHEDNIILRTKETSPQVGSTTPGEINLAVKSSEQSESEQLETEKIETPFPGLNESSEVEPTTPILNELPGPVKSEIDSVVNASLPTSNVDISPNNAHANVEG